MQLTIIIDIMETNKLHCKVFPYGRIDMGKHSDCSNGGPTSKSSMLELWEQSATEADIYQWCREQIKKELPRIEASVRLSFGKLFAMSEDQIAQAVRSKEIEELKILMEKQLVFTTDKNNTSNQYASVPFKKKGLMYMSSGNFVWTNDRTFTEITGSNRPIKCHDRGETQEMYNELSI